MGCRKKSLPTVKTVGCSEEHLIIIVKKYIEIG